MSEQATSLTTAAETTERLRTFAASLRERRAADVIEPTMRYLRGELALDEWLDDRVLAWPMMLCVREAFIPAHTHLDELDLRLVDICLAAGQSHVMIQALSTGPAIQPACDYALDHGVDVASLCRLSLHHLFPYAVNSEHRATPFGAWLLKHLPGQFDAICAEIDTNIAQHTTYLGYGDVGRDGQSVYYSSYWALVQLLLAATPPHVDLAWRVIERAPTTALGQFAALLLDADYTRYAEWGIRVAGPESLATQNGRAAALAALLRQNPAAHVDLALEALRTPLEGKPRMYHLHVQALAGLFAHDPERFFPLLEHACASKDFDLCNYAARVAEGKLPVGRTLPFERRLPLLQRCVAKGHLQVAERVLNWSLLTPEWAGREAYVVSLLAHGSKQIRERASEWLLRRGVLHPDDVAATLHHKQTDVRLLAVSLLGRLGDERAHALLRARLAVEPDARVQQAITAIVGTAEHALHDEDELRARIAALCAEAEAALAGQEAAEREQLADHIDRRPEAPRFYWRSGEPVALHVLIYLLREQLQSKQMQAVLALQRAQALVDRARSGAAALQVFLRVSSMLPKHDVSYALTVATALGDDSLIQHARNGITNHFRFNDATSRRIRVHMLEALGVLDSDAALNAIYDIYAAARSATTWTATRRVLDAAALRRGLTSIELLDSVTPRLGLDDRGECVFDYGPRQFTARLDADGELRLHDDAGRTIADLPTTRAGDLVTLAEAARNDWQALQGRVRAELKRQTARIHEEYRQATVDQRHARQWRHLLLSHPLLRIFAVNLIWVYHLPDAPDDIHAFRALADGTLVDAAGQPVALPEDARVHRLYPSYLAPDEYTAWRRHCADHHLKPPFPQFQ